MESEAEESLIDNVDGSTVRLLGPDAPVVIRHRGTRGSNGGASTHSLNEADLQVSLHYLCCFCFPCLLSLIKIHSFKIDNFSNCSNNNNINNNNNNAIGT